MENNAFAAGAALARSRTAPPSTLLDMSNPDFANPTMLSTLASTAYIEELGGDPSSPASTATGIPGFLPNSQVQFQTHLSCDVQLRVHASCCDLHGTSNVCSAGYV